MQKWVQPFNPFEKMIGHCKGGNFPPDHEIAKLPGWQPGKVVWVLLGLVVRLEGWVV